MRGYAWVWVGMGGYGWVCVGMRGFVLGQWGGVRGGAQSLLPQPMTPGVQGSADYHCHYHYHYHYHDHYYHDDK